MCKYVCRVGRLKQARSTYIHTYVCTCVLYLFFLFLQHPQLIYIFTYQPQEFHAVF